MSNDLHKRNAAAAALEYLQPGQVLGVGSGSTVDRFIDLLAGDVAARIPAAVSSSEATTRRLQEIGIDVVDLNDVAGYPVYVDGADEFDPDLALIKGGGAALTGEKIVVSAAAQFVCIADVSKQVDVLGAFPLPVEVVPMAREIVARQLRSQGGEPVLREAVVTDHGNVILDVHGLRIHDPGAMELTIESLPGVVTCGIFARHRASVVLMGTDTGVEVFE